MKINNRIISRETTPYIIAELSANHGNSLKTALKTVEAAAQIGADAIKLQTFKPEGMTLDIKKNEFLLKNKKVEK